MGIVGNLKTMELAELLQWAAQSRKSGSLVINGRQVKKRLFFDEGRITSVSSSDPKEWLGHFLVSHGFIDEESLAQAMSMQEENKMLIGKILTTIGAIDEESLEKMLKLKSQESVFDLFTWDEGEFRFVEGETPEYGMVPLSMDVTGLVLEGARRLDEWNRIRASITSLQAVPVSIGQLESADGDRAAERILGTVDDDRTIEEIALHTHASEHLVCRVLYEALQAGQLKIVRPRTIGGESPQRAEGSVDPLDLVAHGQEHLTSHRFEPALRYLKAALSLEPSNTEVQDAVEQAEAFISEWLEVKGIVLEKVPQLARSQEELPELQISPQEVFILTRINGEYDIRTILKISPMPALEAQLVFWRLLEAEHITLDAPGDGAAEAKADEPEGSSESGEAGEPADSGAGFFGPGDDEEPN